MSNVGQPERFTQNRAIQLFQQQLGYTYLGDWHDRDHRNIETKYLTQWLQRQSIDDTLITKALRELDRNRRKVLPELERGKPHLQSPHRLQRPEISRQ